MMLTELTSRRGDLPLAALRAHLRLGTGFADDDLQDRFWQSLLRAALAAIEARTGKILIRRAISWTIAAWRDAIRPGAAGRAGDGDHLV